MTSRSDSYSFKNLTAGYKGKTILHSLSGEISPASVTALIGPNGSGKSTLVKAIGGFLPYQGELKLNGRELRTFSRRELGKMIGIVAQQANVKAAFSVYDVIGFGLLPHQTLLEPPSPEDESVILDAAAKLDISHLLFRPVTELSGGERQRVLLAMILAQDPPVCLLDEPTSAMDPCQALLSFQLMRDLAQSGKTVVVVAHDINAALSCADNYIALSGGSIVSAGAAGNLNEKILGELYNTPFAPYISSRGDKVWHPVLKRC